MKLGSKYRTKESYFEKISTKSKSIRDKNRVALDWFDEFNLYHYKENSESILTELLKSNDDERIDTCCEILQNWVNWISSKKQPVTIRDYFSCLKIYLHYRGIKLTKEDVGNNIDFPKIIKEQKYPLQIDIITSILRIAKYDKQSLYLALLSSGMRIGEAIQVRKRDVFTEFQRIMIRLPAKTTKTKTGRTVYLSKEASRTIYPKLKRINDDELVWGTNENPKLSVMAEDVAFRRYLEKIGLDEKYDSGTRKITLHSFRAYFFTKATRCHDENYAHMMTGHGGYLMQYDRLTDEEKLDMYLELEPDLLVYDQTKNEEKIRKLKDANRKLADQAEEIKAQEIRIKNLERRWLADNILHVDEN